MKIVPAAAGSIVTRGAFSVCSSAGFLSAERVSLRLKRSSRFEEKRSFLFSRLKRLPLKPAVAFLMSNAAT